MSTEKNDLDPRIEEALEKGVALLESRQSDDSGSFDLGFDGGALPDAYFVFIESVLGVGNSGQQLVRRLLDRQLAEGGWSLAPGQRGHLSTTVEA